MTFDQIAARLPADADVEWLHRQCVEEGACWLWRGVHTTQGYPVFWVGRPARYVTVRRVAAVLAGRRFDARQPLAATCGNKRCVNPAHVRPSNARAIAQAAVRRGAYDGMARRAKISAARLKRSRISAEAVLAIRLAPSGTLPQVARDWGVAYSTAKAIHCGRMRRDYTSPWAGMGARR